MYRGGIRTVFTIFIIFLLVGIVAASGPTISGVPSTITEAATSSSGAVASYTLPTAAENGTSYTVTCTPTSGSTFPIGTNTVTCTATDNLGNTSSSTFSVVITAPTTPPTITNVPSTITETAASALGTIVSYTLPTATDVFGNSVTVSCNFASGTTFSIGTDAVTCTATDSYGNSATASFNVVITAPTTPPTISGTPTNISSVATGPSGNVETYTTPAAVNVFGASVPVTCSPASNSTFSIGTSIVTCTATDAYGNTATSTFKVVIAKPQVSPTITGTPVNITQTATSSSGSVINYTMPTATDIFGHNLTVSCNPASNSTFPIGTDVVTCNTTDSYGNSAAVSFNVVITRSLIETLESPEGTIVVVLVIGVIVAAVYFIRKKRKSDRGLSQLNF
jgi:hypothetical protein